MKTFTCEVNLELPEEITARQVEIYLYDKLQGCQFDGGLSADLYSQIESVLTDDDNNNVWVVNVEKEA